MWEENYINFYSEFRVRFAVKRTTYQSSTVVRFPRSLYLTRIMLSSIFFFNLKS